ncbi:hypothetical protein ACFQ88_21120 [Paenibacillus sp. NPDC056579]|uniref:hypothetical protein n=1 Tax=unclassified Paenibacillus TaxID=185978 RepID=UPI001EF8395D|nr:hypothetical protein [Paenibacillus sp. H1-7]
MNISELTQEQMKDIMLHAYQLGNESEHIGVKDLVEEIKQQILSALGGKHQ